MKALSAEVVNKRFSSRGFRLVGQYVNSMTRVEIECSNGHRWEAIPNSIKSGNGCPHCSGNFPWTNKTINIELEPRGIQIVGEYKNNFTKVEFECNLGHRWMSKTSHVISGTGCPTCSFDAQRTSKDEINSRLKGRTVQLVGNYTNMYSKTQFHCICENTWYASPASILRGQGCPKCAKHGFNPNKSAWVYVLDFGSFIKYGITNNLSRRLNEHLRKNGDHQVIFTRTYQNGHDARLWEKNITNVFGGKYVSEDVCPDGWTETISPQHLKLLLETIHKS